ncbi:hypothetical protein [Lactobacillus sp. LL6]|uniref:hypothetical protein n=1 Tax=Lactobacillus sp. LL6 TaxID=2596827 RepID=UPI0011867EC4|nr:hypothetical protein [Lactobacillus sp. LL6]TSO26881.1 hypothetical protein FOD82_07625 [Lactobacillus sp. LL6]
MAKQKKLYLAISATALVVLLLLIFSPNGIVRLITPTGIGAAIFLLIGFVISLMFALNENWQVNIKNYRGTLVLYALLTALMITKYGTQMSRSSAVATFLAIVCLINAAILEYRKSRE